jgi:hypothetical protein
VRQILPISVLLLFLAACTFLSAEEKGLQLTMDSTAYNVNSLAILRIENYSGSPLYMRGCTTVFPLYSVQKRQEDGAWADVYTITCSPRPPAPRKVDVESAIQAQLRIRFDVGRAEPTAGTYRIRMWLHRDAQAATPALAEDRSVTVPFQVR